MWWLVWLAIAITSNVNGKKSSKHKNLLEDVDHEDDFDLDYSHNIFVPLDAYDNYEKFLEYAQGTDLAKRSGVTALPVIQSLPADGEHTYAAPGINCQVRLTNKQVEGTDKRVIERTTCPEGWTLKDAMKFFFADVGQTLQSDSAGLVHIEQLKFKMLVFEPSGGFSFFADTDGEDYSNLQSKLSLSGAEFKLTMGASYSYESSEISITGEHAVTERLTNEEKQLSVTFEKGKDTSNFVVKMDVPSMKLETFATVFLASETEFITSDIGDISFNINIDVIKSVQIQSTSNSVIGVFDTEEGKFQLTGKFSSSDQNAFMGEATDIYLTVNRNSLGAPTYYNLMLGFAKTVNVLDVVQKYIGKTEIQEQFDDKFLKNPIEKWHIMFTSHNIKLPDEDDYENMFSSIFASNEYKEFKQGVGIKVQVNLQETISQCGGGTVPDNLSDIKINGLLTRLGLSLKFPSNVAVPLLALMKCKLRETAADIGFDIPNYLKKIEEATNFKLEEFAYDNEEGSFKIGLMYTDTITIYEGVLEITNPKLEIEREGTDEPWQFAIAADIMVFGVEASVSVQYSKTGFTVEVSSDVIPLTNLLNAFNFGNDPPFTFEIHDFKMQLVVSDKEEEEASGDDEESNGDNQEGGGSKSNKTLLMKRQDDNSNGGDSATPSARDMKFSIAGKPVFNGFDKVTIEAMVWTSQTPVGVAVAVVMENVRLDEVLESILGVDEVPMAWFSDMSLTIAVSNTDAEGCDNPAADPDSEECQEEEEGEEEGGEDDTENDQGNEVDGNGQGGNSTNSGGNKKKKKKVQKTKVSKSIANKKRKLRKKGKFLKNIKQLKRKNKAAKKNVKLSKRSDDDSTEEDEEEEEEEEEGGGGFSLDHLGGIDLVRGLYISAEFGIPEDCKKDKLCEWLKSKVGAEAKLTIEGTFTTSGFTLAAGITMMLELSEDLFLTEASLELAFTTEERSVALVCKLQYNNVELSGKEGLEFIGKLKVSFTGELEISMQMKGMIYEPFGVEKVAFGNLFMSLGVTIAAGLPSFQLGARIMVGKGVKNHGSETDVFIFEGYFGFNPADPTDNYIYAKRSGDPLTLNNFMKNFEIDVTLPEKIGNSGFYGETIFSFSALGKEVEDLDLEIPAGIYFKGALKILDFDIYAELNINTDPENLKLYANITLSPISWIGGLLRISRSATDDANGPFLIIDIDAETLKLEIQGFAYCLGISTEIAVKINETHFYYHLAGNLFSVISASITVEASYGVEELADMSYSFHGCVTIDLRRIGEIVLKTMKDAQKAVTNAMAKAREKINNAKQAVTAAFAKVREWKQGIENYKARLRARSAELERKKAELNYSCKDRCGKVCIGFLDWNPHCWKVWGHWCGCPKWNSCRWRADDIICIAGCELKRAWGKFVTWAEQVGVQIMLGLSEVAQALLSGLSLFEGIAQGVLSFANGFLTVAEAFTNAVLDGIGAIVNAAANVIVVEHFCLSGNLKPVESACVSCDAKILIFGHPIEWAGEFCIDLSFFQLIGKKTAVQHTPEIADIDAKVQEFESEGNKVDAQVTDMKTEQNKQGKEVGDKTSKRIDTNGPNKRSRVPHVPTEEEAYFYRLAYDRIPEVNTRSFATEKSMKDGAPWLLSQEWTSSKRTLNDDPSTLHRRILDTDNDDHCKNVENLYSNYQNVAEGFGTFLRSADKQKAGFQAMKRSYIEGMNYLKNEFEYGDKMHNVTDEEREHVKYWEEYVKNGLNSHIEKTQSLLQTQRKSYIPDFREQVNQVFKEQTKSTLPEYIKKMKTHVIGFYQKRSGIPQDHMEKQLKKWNSLHQALGNIASSETASYRDLSIQVATVNNMLSDLKRSDIPCSA